MKKEELFFDSRDGSTKIYAVRYLPDDGNVRGVLQIIHGMAEHIERYEEFAQYMTEKGFCVVGEDHLGHGKSVAKGGLYGYFCKQDPATVVVRDAHRLKKLTQSLFPGKPYIILGHSMGSFILRNYMFKYSTGIDGAIIMGTGLESKLTVYLGKFMTFLNKVFLGPKRKAYFLDKLGFGKYLKKIENPKSHFDWLTRDEARVAEYLQDPMCGFTFTVNGFETLFELMKRLYNKENLSGISKNLPTLFLSGGEDPVGYYGKAVETSYNMLKSAGLQNVTLHIYKEDRHELLNENNRDKVMADIAEWIEKNCLGEEVN